MQTASSASLTCSECSSADEYTATVEIPSSRQARITRSAISPRLAIRTLRKSGGSALATGRLAALGISVTRSVCTSHLDEEKRLAELHGLPVFDQDGDDLARELGLDLVHQLHRFDDAKNVPFLDRLAFAHVHLGGR